jgi:hypothetical protein
MTIITKSYDKQSKSLTVTYLNPYHLVGFDCRGLKVYSTIQETRTFVGFNKHDCVHRMNKYFGIPERYVVHRKYEDLGSRVIY